eukprot:2293604-Amphidinium_carterae.1
MQATIAPFAWIMLLDSDAAILTDEDILRRVLQHPSVGTRTHIIVFKKGQNTMLLDSADDNSSNVESEYDSGIVLIKQAAWSDGFLHVWLRELSQLSKEGNMIDGGVAVDHALAVAVQKTRKLAGESAAVEFAPDEVVTDLLRYRWGSAREDA